MIFAPQQTGQGVLEYAMLLLLVALVIIVILWVFGGSIGDLYSNVVNHV